MRLLRCEEGGLLDGTAADGALQLLQAEAGCLAQLRVLSCAAPVRRSRGGRRPFLQPDIPQAHAVSALCLLCRGGTAGTVVQTLRKVCCSPALGRSAAPQQSSSSLPLQANCRYSKGGLRAGLAALKGADRSAGQVLAALQEEGLVDVHLALVRRDEWGEPWGGIAGWDVGWDAGD